MRGGVKYSSDGNRRWWRTEWEPRCENEGFISGKCQGVHGHKDVHWSFGPDGSFQWSDNKNDPRENGCSGTTPPGHRHYRAPLSMQKHCYRTRYTTMKVTDKKIVARLERDKTPEKGASISRPFKP